MRREKDIVGPEHGVTDLGVSLPRGVQAHRKDEMLHKLNQWLKAWESEAGDDAAGLALPEDVQQEIIQDIQKQVTPLIKEHDAAHFEKSGAEYKYNLLEKNVTRLGGLRDNPLLDIYRTERILKSTKAELKAARAELNKALKAVKNTDSKLPSWLQQHQ